MSGEGKDYLLPEKLLASQTKKGGKIKKTGKKKEKVKVPAEKG